MDIDSQTSLLCIFGSVMLFVVLFSIIKGILRMIFLSLAITGAILVWVFVQNKGFILLSMLTSSPQPWMVQALAWSSAALVLFLSFYILNWFAHIFSPTKGKAGFFGIMTTTLFCVLMVWTAIVAVSYYGTISRVSYYHELAEAHYHGAEMPDVPLFTRGKQVIRTVPALSWLEAIDPLESAAQSNLACIVAYGCSLSETEYTRFYKEKIEPMGVPHPTRFLELFADDGLRKLVAEGRFVSLLEKDRLNTFLEYNGTRAHIEKWDGSMLAQ